MSSKEKNVNRNILASDNIAVIICRWAIWAGLLLVLLVPLVVKLDLFFPFTSSKGLWLMASVQFTFACWSYLVLIDRTYRPRLNLITLIFIFYLVSISLSALFGPDPVISFWSKHERMTGVIMHFHLFALFLIITTFLKKEKDWQRLFFISIIVATLVSAWGLADNFSIQPVLEIFNITRIVSLDVSTISRQGSTLGNTSFMGSYLLISSFIALYFVLSTTGKARAAGFLFLLVICLGVLLNPGGRAMKGAMIFGLVVLVLLYLSFKQHNKYLKRGGQALLFSIFAISAYIAISAFIKNSFIRNLIMTMQGMDLRFVNWQIAWQGIMEKPLIGWGFDNYELVFFRHLDPLVMLAADGSVLHPWYDRAHNVVFDNLVMTGFIGTLLFFGLFAAALLVLWRRYTADKKLSFYAPAVFTALLIAHFTQNLTVFDMPPSYMLLFIILAFAAAHSQPLELNLPEFKAIKPLSTHCLILAATICLCLFISLHYLVYRPYRSGLYVVQAVAESSGDPLIDYYTIAVESSPLGRHELRIQIATNAMNRLAKAEEAARDSIYFKEADYIGKELYKSFAESPLHFKSQFTQGQLKMSAGYRLALIAQNEEEVNRAKIYFLEAEGAFREALALSPRYIQAYWEMSQLLLYQGFLFDDNEKILEAFETAEKAVRIEPRFFNSHNLVINIAADFIGDRELALKKLEEALMINPAWEDTLLKHINAGAN